MEIQTSSSVEQNIQKINEAVELLKTGMPLSVVSKIIGLPKDIIQPTTQYN